MAVSGSFDMNSTAGELINDALEYCGKRDLLQTTPAEVSATCMRTFNFMMKFWQARDIGLWLKEDVTLFLEEDAQSYDIYSSGDHASTAMVKTELSTAGVSTDLTIEVDSITGITTGDVIGVELDDGSIDWTTVNGVPAGTTVTITVALTGAAAIDNHVYTYTTKAQKPLELEEARIHLSGDTEYPLRIVSKDEYKRLSDKTSSGKCVQVYPDFRIDRMTLYVWPTADSVKDYINLTVRRRIDDIDGLTNNAAFPPEWLLPLSINLAYWVGPKFGCSLEKMAILKDMAKETLETLMMFDQENTGFTVEPR